MKEREEVLERYLDQIQAGEPLDALLDKMNGERDEHGRLLVVAQALREAPDPQPSPARAFLEESAVMAAIDAYAPPLPLGKRLNRWWSSNFALRPQLAGLALVAALVLVIAALALQMFLGNATTTATLLEATGQVTIATSAEGPWDSATSGLALKPGNRLRTGPNATATVAFYEGTKMSLGPNTEIVLTTLEGEEGTLTVKLEQVLGTTTHEVVPLMGQNATYDVKTPSGEARVGGTTFSIEVNPDGEARYTVDSGILEVNGFGGKVLPYEESMRVPMIVAGPTTRKQVAEELVLDQCGPASAAAGTGPGSQPGLRPGNYPGAVL